MHAYGSSSRASATRRRPRASWCPGWCARRLSPAARPWDTRLDDACPPVGRWGLTAPRAPGRCAATPATGPSQGPALGARSPIPWPASMVRGRPAGLVAWAKRPDRARAWGRPVPQAGHGLKETGGAPTCPPSPAEALPRSQTPVVAGARAPTHPGRRPSGPWQPSAFPLPRRSPCRGSLTRPVSALHPAPYGP